MYEVNGMLLIVKGNFKKTIIYIDFIWKMTWVLFISDFGFSTSDLDWQR